MGNPSDFIIQEFEKVRQLPTTVPGIFLHLGCGPNILEGFINVDKYVPGKGVMPWDLGKIELPENTVQGIYSSHSLEHLNIRDGHRALVNWFKVLKPGGRLYLAVPDLKEICRHIANDLPFNTETWWLFTLFGYQAHTEAKGIDVPDEPGQYHMSGYTPETITRKLESIGYKIIQVNTYDGWGTPSIWAVAEK